MRLALLAVLALLFAPAGAIAADGPALTVDAAAGQHAISPAIYGMNGADPTLMNELHIPVDRWGGNDKERYNWRTQTTNSGYDWFFENHPDDSYTARVDADRAAGATTVLQIPLIGEVAKDGNPTSCGFPVSVFGPQASADHFNPSCGNGNGAGPGDPALDDPYRPGTGPLANPSGTAGTTSVPFGPADGEAWVQDLVSRYGTTAQGGVGYYELGNEPNLWNSSHRDVHPQPTTYDELGEKSIAMATAVKQADPTARVIGYSEWGWTNYVCSAKDVAPLGYGCDATDVDRAAHGGTALSAWYLQTMRNASVAAGHRLLDDFDLHYYAQDGGYGIDASRALWDPTYVDGSWIGTAGENQSVHLLPRMRQWVDENYPGTGISLSEYNLTDLSAAQQDTVVSTLVEADALGIFAREGVDMAAMWAPPGPHDRVADAFRLYRDYDGNGSRFGDTYVASTSANEQQVAVYGARRTADGALTVVVLNKSTVARTAPLTVRGFASVPGAQVWQWADRGIARQADAAVAGGTITQTYPARSMTLLVVPPGSGTGTNPPSTTETTPTTPIANTTPTTATTPTPETTPPSTVTVPPPVTTPRRPPTPKAARARIATKTTTLDRRHRRLSFRVACAAGGRPCRGTLAVARGKTKLGSARLAIAAGRTATVRVTLPRARAATVARYGRRGQRATVTVALGSPPTRATVTLRGR